jgi:hypothetical protein
MHVRCGDPDFCCQPGRLLIQLRGMSANRLPGPGFHGYPLAALCCLLLAACRAPMEEGTRKLAADTRALTDVEVITLPNNSSLADLEQRFGPGEPQSGNRLAYRSVKSPEQFFWVYPYHSPAGEQKIHHIALADQLEEKGKVVWPVKWKDMAPASAAYIHSKTQAY